ncbi:hypothetical protein HP439_14760 [Sphingobacterium shayense]|uniref:hypothetical protein n=1 Tax=Sphingobacterium shayense TaxID=626343 RepID=UPI0015550147|nr:hypothetical protein [Sphingobacterium shayense]NQD71985.1 hypothetical protein [Sphingobacterium shayense]
MELKNLVHNWFLGGADPTVGLRLFMDYTKPSLPVARIVSKNPDKHLQVIRVALLNTSGLPLDIPLIAGSLSGKQIESKQDENKYAIRTQWPFLSDPDCPPEMKLLISDKISVYRNCILEYDSLSKSTSAVEQLDTVRALVINFIYNHDIYKELKYYKDTGKILGEHKIFAQYQRIKELRNIQTVDLFKRKKNLEYSIWRNESKIKKENRPDLVHSRQEKIKELKMVLAEVNRLLE